MRSWRSHSSSPAITLGHYGVKPFRRPLTLSVRERATHIHVIGVSGSGKSRFLAGLFLELLDAGCAVTVLDPHGDLVRDILKLLIARGAYRDPAVYERIVYLDLPAAQRNNLCLPLNVLKQPVSAYIVAANVMDALHRYWPALDGGAAPRFDKLVQYGVKVLVSAGLSLPLLGTFLMDHGFRRQLLQQEPDLDIVSFWERWYGELTKQPRLLLDYTDSTLSRISLLAHDPFLKYSLAAQDLLVDFTALMDANTSLLVNLKLENREVGRLLGCLLTVLAEQAAMTRTQPGKAHYLMLDEFASFVDTSPKALETMLSQTRKMGVFAVLAHQNWSQTPVSLKGALQNCGIKVAFALDYDDAVITSRIIGRVEPKSVREVVDEVTVENVGMSEQWQTLIQQLQDLPPRHAFIRARTSPKPFPWSLLQPAKTSALYRVKTVPVPDPLVDARVLESVERAYLTRYFQPQEQVEQHLSHLRGFERGRLDRFETINDTT